MKRVLHFIDTNALYVFLRPALLSGSFVHILLLTYGLKQISTLGQFGFQIKMLLDLHNSIRIEIAKYI